jgi:hypothetical protein
VKEYGKVLGEIGRKSPTRNNKNRIFIYNFYEMDIQDLKLEIIRKVAESADVGLLRVIQNHLQNDDEIIGQTGGKPFTTAMLKEEISEAQADYSEGRVKSHSEVKALFQSKFEND